MTCSLKRTKSAISKKGDFIIKRYEELDSLRGVAAFIVLISHFLFLFPSTMGEIIDKKFGVYFSILWNGHASVMMFFILSGFVLSVPLFNKKNFSYPDYLIKRICRIYVPYIVIILITFTIQSLISPVSKIPNLVFWALWNENVDFNKIIDHVLFLGEFNSDAFNAVIWSLVHEMRISIIFPFIVLMIIRLNWVSTIVLAISCSFISFWLKTNISTEFDKLISTNYSATIHYLSMFVIGALLSKYKDLLINKIVKLKLNYLLIPLGILFFNYPKIPYMIVAKIIPNIPYALYEIHLDFIITIGASFIIMSALSSNLFSRLLLIRPIQLLGRISYSIYLVHMVILVALIHALYGILPTPMILGLAFVLTMVVSWLCYKYIEKPSIKLGKYLISKKHVSIKTIEKTG